MNHQQYTISNNKILGNFTTFDVAKNDDYLIAASHTNETVNFDLNYGTNKSMQLDCIPVHIKYYPDGNKLFTTTNYSSGLSVWDVERIIKLYNYKHNCILYHCYNDQRNISACTNEGIKIYDLRCRFHIDFVKINGCKRIDWREYAFCAVGNDSILFGDIRNSQKSQNIVERNVEDAKFYKNTYCCTVKNQNKLNLKLENVNKQCYGNKLSIINGRIVIPNKNKLYFYTMQDEWINELVEVCDIKEINHKNNKMYIMDDEQILIQNLLS